MHPTDNCLVAAAETSAIASCTQKGWWLAGWRAMRPLSGVRAAHSNDAIVASGFRAKSAFHRSDETAPWHTRDEPTVCRARKKPNRGLYYPLPRRRDKINRREDRRARLRSAVGDAQLRSTLILALELDERAQRPQRHEPWVGRHIMRIAPKPDQTHSQEGIHPAYTRLCHRVSGPRNTRRSVPPQPHVKREEAITSSLMLNACVSTCPMSMCGRCCKYQRTSASSSSMSSSLHVSRMAKQT